MTRNMKIIIGIVVLILVGLVVWYVVKNWNKIIKGKYMTGSIVPPNGFSCPSDQPYCVSARQCLPVGDCPGYNQENVPLKQYGTPWFIPFVPYNRSLN